MTRCRWSIGIRYLVTFLLISPIYWKYSEALRPNFIVDPSSTARSKLFAASQQQDTSDSSTISTTDERRVARRWNGNYKHASTKMCDVPKAKKLQLHLSVQQADRITVTKTVEKKRQETLQHVLTKAMLWKLYCNEYPGIEIELDIGDPNYLPDVISLDVDGNPLFWGESGRMKVHKAIDLMQRYPNTHIVHCRWDMDVDAIAGPLQEHLQHLLDTDCLDDLPRRGGRFTFCSLPLDVWRFVDEETGIIHIAHGDLDWKELEFPSIKTTPLQKAASKDGKSLW